MPFFTSNGANLHVQVSGDGPPLLLLHELTLDHRQWAPQLEVWNSSRRLYRLDRRGHGRSDRAASGYGWSGGAADVQRAAVQVGMSRHAPGAVVAQGESCDAALQLALAEPRAIRAVVLVAPEIWGVAASPERESLRAAMQAQAGAGAVAAALELLRADATFAGVRRDPELLRSVCEMQSKFAAVALRRDEADTGATTASRLEHCQVPVLIVCGDGDHDDFRRTASVIASECPRAHVTTCDGTVHFPNLESPDAFTAVVGDFLREHV